MQALTAAFLVPHEVGQRIFLEVLINPLAAYGEPASLGHGNEFRRIIDDFFGTSGLEQVVLGPLVLYPVYASGRCGTYEIVDGLELVSAPVFLFTRLGDRVE